MVQSGHHGVAPGQVNKSFVDAFLDGGFVVVGDVDVGNENGVDVDAEDVVAVWM